jgi:hypothetical protein
MPGSKKKKTRRRTRKPKTVELDPLRRGMPAKDSIVKVEDFVSPQGDRYQILKTTETDVYDPMPKSRKKRGQKS